MVMPASAVETEPQSFISWMFEQLGPYYGIGLPLLGLLLLAAGVHAVLTSGGPGRVAAYLALVPLPLLVGLIGMLQGLGSAATTVAESAVQPVPKELAGDIALAIFAPLLSLYAALPGYCVLAIGFLLRNMRLESAAPAAIRHGRSGS
jgi:hypothetical protein